MAEIGFGSIIRAPNKCKPNFIFAVGRCRRIVHT